MAKLFRANPSKASLPKQLTVVIEGITHEGRGIARWKNKPLFVRGAWINETLNVKVIREQSRFAEAEVIDVIRPHPDRVQPKCAIADVCGGCHLQHVPDDAQIHYKQQWVTEQLERFGAAAPLSWLSPLTASPWQYRHRARLSVWRDRQGHKVLGFREQGTKTIVPVSECPTLVRELSCLLTDLQNVVRQEGKHCSIEHVELLWDGQRRAVIIRAGRYWQTKHQTQWEGLARRWGSHLPVDIWMRSDDRCLPLCSSDGKAIDDELPYSYRLPEWDVDIHFHPSDFTQVNFPLNQSMVSLALRLLTETGDSSTVESAAVTQWRVLDLFCGVGNFTLPLASVCGSVIGVEALPHMVARGQFNADKNGIDNAEFVAADLTKEETLSAPWLKQHVDAVLLDPPRAGAKDILPTVVALGVSRVIYVSCNSASLARDAAFLQAQGYVMTTAAVMDMFPQTSHVETLALFVKR